MVRLSKWDEGHPCRVRDAERLELVLHFKSRDPCQDIFCLENQRKNDICPTEI